MKWTHRHTRKLASQHLKKTTEVAVIERTKNIQKVYPIFIPKRKISVIANPEPCKKKMKSENSDSSKRFCLICHKTISRSNNYYFDRHKQAHSLKGLEVLEKKHLVPVDSPAASRILRKQPGPSKEQDIVETEKVSEVESTPCKNSKEFENVLPALSTESTSMDREFDAIVDTESIEGCSIEDSCETRSTHTLPALEQLMPSVGKNFKTQECIEKYTYPTSTALRHNSVGGVTFTCDEVMAMQKQILEEIKKLNNSQKPSTSQYSSRVHFLEKDSDSEIDNRTDMEALRKSKNINDFLERTTMIVAINVAEEVIIRCEVCFQAASCESQRSDLHDNLKTYRRGFKGWSTFASGIPILLKNLQESGQPWYSYKHRLLNHLQNSEQHGNAFKNSKYSSVNTTVLRITANLMKSALCVIKMKSANQNYEKVISLLDACDCEVGTMGHGRMQLNDIILAFKSHGQKNLNEIMEKKLPSTMLPPHYGTTSDKSTLGRETNHAVMVLILVDGVRKAIPIGAPLVYQETDNDSDDEITGGRASDLADQVIDTLKDFALIEKSHLNYHMAHHADGQYQNSAFKNKLIERCHSEDRDRAMTEEFNVVPWDASHWLNLSITDVRDGKINLKSSKTLKTFIRRTNKFSELFGHGLGCTQLKTYAANRKLKARQISNFSTTRFVSSAFESLKSIYDSSEALIGCYTDVMEIDDACNTIKYEVKGVDYYIELCMLLDFLRPVVQLMTVCQAVSTNLWTINVLCPRVLHILEEMLVTLAEGFDAFDEELFPTLARHKDELQEQKFKGKDLHVGWLTKMENPPRGKSGKSNSLVSWEARETEEVLQDLCNLGRDIKDSIKRRFNNENGKEQVTEVAKSLCDCFEINQLLKLLCGYREVTRGEPVLSCGKPALERHGLEAFKQFFKYVTSLQHVHTLQLKESLLLEKDLYCKVFGKFKDALYFGIWKDESQKFLAKWLPNCNSIAKKERLQKMECFQKRLDLLPTFLLTFESSSCEATVDETTLFSSFYIDKEIYEQAGVEMCICLDVALAKGGSEAVVESLYSVMGNHYFQGGQGNDTLVNRTIVDYMFGLHKDFQETYEQVGKLYLLGDEKLGLKKHKAPKHKDIRNRGKFSSKSKVLARLGDENKKGFIF